jgi:hypothetical protein
MTKEHKNENFEMDTEKLAHELRSALLSFRESRDSLTTEPPDRDEARIFFSAGEERLLNLIEKVSGTRE